MASAPAAAALLASTSPRRRQILGQLRIPSGAVVRPYEETEDDPVAHALGKDRSVLAEADGCLLCVPRSGNLELLCRTSA